MRNDEKRDGEEALKASIAECNMALNRALDSMYSAMRALLPYRESFSGQRRLEGNALMMIRTLQLAAGRLESLRPRNCMIDEGALAGGLKGKGRETR